MSDRHGRNKKSTSNKNYIAENRRIKNKIRKMVKTIKLQPNNKELKNRYDKLQNSK